MTGIIIAALFSFAATNVDDLFINMFFFAQADTAKKAQMIVIGKYLGIGALFSVSLAGAWFAQALPHSALRLLGIVPIALGIRSWLHRNDDLSADTPSANDSLAISTAVITIANGADNIGVYAPLFAGFDLGQKMLCVLLFMVMTVLWCALAALIAAQPQLKTILRRYRRVLVPVVLMLLGLYILLTNLLPLFA